MFKLDNEFLTSLGLGGLPVDEKNRLLQMIYERLEMNVGMRLAEKMTDAQLDEFESFIDRNDEAGALTWLESNFPNYKDVVAEELEKLKVEVQQAAPQILAAAQAAPAPQPATMGQPQAYYPQDQPAPQSMPPAPVAPQQPNAADLMSYQPPAQPQYQQPMYQPPTPQPQPYQPSPPPYQPPAQPQQPTQPPQYTPPPSGFNPGQ